MNRIISIIKKNLKLLVRAKSSALIVVLGPLLLIFLVGLAFDNTQAYQVSIGTYSEGYNELSTSFIENLKESQFRVEAFPTEELCIDAIKQGKVHTCMVFPPGLQIGKEGSNQITFHIDYSRINLVWSILDTVSGHVTERSSQISLNLTNTVLNALLQVRDRAIKTKPILVDSTTKNSDVQKKVSDVKKDLIALDLSMNPAEFKLTEIQTWATSFQQQVQTLITGSDKYFANITSRTNDVIDSVEDANLSTSTENAIIGDLEEILNLTKKVDTLVSGQTSLSTTKITELNTLLDQIEGKVTETKTKIDGVVQFREGANAKLSEVDQLLTNSLNNIVVIQKNMNFIESTVDSIEFKEASSIVAPITTQIKPVITEKTHLNYLFPSLIVLVIMFICILLSAILVEMEKNSKANFRSFLTPTPDIIFVVATYLTTMILLVIQLAIILGTTAIFFKARVFGNLWISALVLLLIGTFFSLFGMLIGYVLKSEETATLAAISIGTIFLLLSGLVLPMESMPQYIRDVAEYNPYVIGEGVLRKAMLFSANIGDMDIAIYTLLGYSAAVFYIIYLLQKLSKKRLLSGIFKLPRMRRAK